MATEKITEDRISEIVDQMIRCRDIVSYETQKEKEGYLCRESFIKFKSKSMTFKTSRHLTFKYENCLEYLLKMINDGLSDGNILVQMTALLKNAVDIKKPKEPEF